MTRIAALFDAAKTSMFTPPDLGRPLVGVDVDDAQALAERSTAAASSFWNSVRTRSAVSWPMAIAKALRMTSVSAAVMSASRQRIEKPSSTQHVPRPADRVQQPRLAAVLELARRFETKTSMVFVVANGS
jgi:hypothetical protein